MSETPLGARPTTIPPKHRRSAPSMSGPAQLDHIDCWRPWAGGMGELWLADQTGPMRRHVALKIVKLGMDSAQVVARFDADRQALALLDNPAIARCSTPLRATSTFGQGGDYVPTGHHRHR
jgi:hypothetical protein